MVKSFEDFQQAGKDSVEASVKAFGAVSTKAQAIATEVADYSKKSFEEGSAAFEKLLGVKSIDKVFEVQADYARSSYESFVSQASKLGALYADLAKETYRPFEAFAAKA